MTQTHLENYLAYYLTLQKPGFALLVTGDWGTGKTHQVKAILDGLPAGPKEGPPYYYVSLFGLASEEAIKEALLYAADPELAKTRERFNVAGDAAQKAGGFWAVGGFFANKLSAAIKVALDADRTIVFDDLERCAIGLREIQGLINQYVEHRGFRVIIIAHDERIESEFTDTKEKIVGQTIRVMPETEAAFDFFASSMIGDAAAIVKELKTAILAAMDRAGVRSLRILRYVMGDFARLVVCLREDQRTHRRFMLDLTETFVETDFLLRAGTESGAAMRLRYGFAPKEQLSEQEKAEMVAAEVHANPRIDPLHVKYRTETPVLPPELLRRMLELGHFESAEIQKAADESPYFLNDLVPAWKSLLNYWLLGPEEIAAERERFFKQFKERTALWPPELLHVFAIRLLLATLEDATGGLAKATAECLEYIDDITEDPDAPRWDVYALNRELPAGRLGFMTQHDGYRYLVPKTTREAYDRVQEALNEEHQKMLDRTLRRDAETSLSMLGSDPAAFYGFFSSGHGDGRFEDFHILKAIAPESFVDAVLRSPHSSWPWVRRMFFARHNRDGRHDHFESEADWLAEVAGKIDAAAMRKNCLERLKISELMPDELREKLAKRANGNGSRP